MLPAVRNNVDSEPFFCVMDDIDYGPYDVCTTGSSSLSRGVKRQISEMEVHEDYLPKLRPVTPRNTNVLDLLHNRQIGLRWKSSFSSEYAHTKSKEMTVSNWFPTLCGGEREFVKHSLHNKSLITVWKEGSLNKSCMHFFKFHFNHKYDNCRSKPSLVQTMFRSSKILLKGNVVDICEIPHSNSKCLLYVSNTPNCESQLECDTVLIDFDIPFHKFCARAPDKYIYCCACNGDGQVFATGSEDGCSIFNNQRVSHKIKMVGGVPSVALNNSGNTLFCGTSKFGLKVFDLRERYIENSTVSSLYYKPGGISEMKLLSDEKSIILCDETGLSKVDLNKSEPAVKYEGHSYFKNRSSLSISEDLLCATGPDNLTRVWSLSTGKLLHTISPQLSDGNVHSSLLTCGNRWSVTLLQKDKLFFIEPCITS